MQQDPDRLQSDLETLQAVQGKGPLATLGAYFKLSGPGWLQSAITLGGGSLAGSLYLGVLAGYSMLWLQPLAMIMGIVMLSAIAYVVLSTGERPFGAINKHINPVLGWSWAIATLMANMVWALPQYSLATGVVEQNLLPGTFGAGGILGKLLIVAVILAITTFVTWSYGKGSTGVRIYERVLKIVVAMIVLSFIGVVVRLSTAADGVQWRDILVGFVPDLDSLSQPAAAFQPLLDAVSEPAARQYWTAKIVGDQRDVMIAAAATAVGINMTFLLPYTLLARGWGKAFRGLARFDLATGMLIPFLLATSCVVIASASRFHAKPVAGLVAEDVVPDAKQPSRKDQKAFVGILAGGLKDSLGGSEYDRRFVAAAGASKAEKEAKAAALRQATRTMTLGERRLAATLIRRDANSLAQALRPLTNDFFANTLFGFGVLAMALSTITILMLISGFVICEMLGVPPEGKALRYGALAAATGALGPFFWGQAAVYLAVPTSVIGMMLLPIAYWTFFCMMNSRRLLGDALPSGGTRVGWNLLMLLAAGLATFASLWSVWSKTGAIGLGVMGALLLFALVVHFARRKG